MPIQLEPLPFSPNSLEPFISRETIECHYGKHHKAYVDKTNELIRGTDYENLELVEILLKSYEDKQTKIFNNSSQAWNHSFFWKVLTPTTAGISDSFKKIIIRSFGSFENLTQLIKEESLEVFGTGWAWLVKNEDTSLSVVGLQDAENPLCYGKIPLLTCDLWEHAYYLDYKNERGRFIDSFWRLVNWSFVESNFASQSKATIKTANHFEKDFHLQ